MLPTCTYCHRELDQPEETHRAVEGWETVDGQTELKWRTLDRFACCSCVDEHFVGLNRDVEEAEDALPPQ